jgi:hypothetical protein
MPRADVLHSPVAGMRNFKYSVQVLGRFAYEDFGLDIKMSKCVGTLCEI